MLFFFFFVTWKTFTHYILQVQLNSTQVYRVVTGDSCFVSLLLSYTLWKNSDVINFPSCCSCCIASFLNTGCGVQVLYLAELEVLKFTKHRILSFPLGTGIKHLLWVKHWASCLTTASLVSTYFSIGWPSRSFICHRFPMFVQCITSCPRQNPESHLILLLLPYHPGKVCHQIPSILLPKYLCFASLPFRSLPCLVWAFSVAFQPMRLSLAAPPTEWSFKCFSKHIIPSLKTLPSVHIICKMQSKLLSLLIKVLQNSIRSVKTRGCDHLIYRGSA